VPQAYDPDGGDLLSKTAIIVATILSDMFQSVVCVTRQINTIRTKICELMLQRFEYRSNLRGLSKSGHRPPEQLFVVVNVLDDTKNREGEQHKGVLGVYYPLEDWIYRLFVLLLLERHMLAKPPMFSADVAGGKADDDREWHQTPVYTTTTNEMTAAVKHLVRDAKAKHPEEFPTLDSGTRWHGMRKIG
jgi:hypothetical protein